MTQILEDAIAKRPKYTTTENIFEKIMILLSLCWLLKLLNIFLVGLKTYL